MKKQGKWKEGKAQKKSGKGESPGFIPVGGGGVRDTPEASGFGVTVPCCTGGGGIGGQGQ